MDIMKYIKKETIKEHAIVGFTGAVLATIITSIIDSKEIKKSTETVEEAHKTLGEAREAAERLQKTMEEINAEVIELLKENEMLRRENEELKNKDSVSFDELFAVKKKGE